MVITGKDRGRELDALFSPSSVAVVGASDDPRKWGHWLGIRALRGEHRRKVSFVNRRSDTVLGRPVWNSIRDLPEPAELVVLAVPGAHVEAGVREAIGAGARAIVVISSGADGEAGGDGDAVIAGLAREAGVALLGPNCLGVFDANEQLELVSDDLPAGSIGLISQSGQLSLEIGAFAARSGLGFSRFVSLGNQADLVAADLVRTLAQHNATSLIALYIEDFRDGRDLVEAARSTDKPVLLIAAGNSEAAARAARSHTGALASDTATIDAACRAGGIHRVASPRELVDLASMLLNAPRPPGRRVAVVADGGGHGGLAASLAEEAGLAVPELGDRLGERLRASLPPTAAVPNPIDLAGAGEQDVRSFERVIGTLLSSGEVDSVLLSGFFGGYAGYGPETAAAELAVADALAKAALETHRPLVVHSMHPESPAGERLRSGGVPVFETIDRAVKALAGATEIGPVAPGREGSPDGQPGPNDPPPDRSADLAMPLGLPAPAAPVSGDGYAEARDLLSAGGVPFVSARIIEPTSEAAREAACSIGFPVVLKALGMLHKSDAGGVKLGIKDEAALEKAVTDLVARLAPPSLSIERMAPIGDGVELIAGVRWDARFGPVVLTGIGGIFTEVMKDTAIALGPLDVSGARRLLLGLRGAALLTGVRGRPPVDIAGAAAALSALSEVAATHPEFAEIEVNPLLVTPDSVLALDARVVRA